MMRTPAPGVFAATILLTVLLLGGSLLADVVATSARAQALARASALIVRIEAPQEADALARAVATLRATPGVRSAAAIDAVRAARLLEAEGGGAVDPADMPPLFLIEAERAPDLASDARIETALRAAGVSAELVSDTADTDPAPTIAWSAAGAGATLLLLVLALVHGAGAHAGAALAADLGAPRGRVLAAHGRAAHVRGFTAGGLGAVIAAAGGAGLLLGGPNPASFSDMLTSLSASQLALVLTAPLATAAAATLGARFGAARAYDRADRLA